MQFQFTFKPDTNPQGDTAFQPPLESFYMTRIEKVEDMKEQDGSVKRFRVTAAIEPSYRILGDPSSKVSKSFDYADDGKVMKLLSTALGMPIEQLKAQGVVLDPCTVLLNRMLPVYFKPKGWNFTDEATGKPTTADMFLVVDPATFQGLRNAWCAEHPNVKFAGAQAAPPAQQQAAPPAQQGAPAQWQGAPPAQQAAPPPQNGTAPAGTWQQPPNTSFAPPPQTWAPPQQ